MIDCFEVAASNINIILSHSNSRISSAISSLDRNQNFTTLHNFSNYALTLIIDKNLDEENNHSVIL